MHFRLSLTLVFKYQKFVTVICCVPIIWYIIFSYHYLPADQVLTDIIPRAVVTILLYSILMLLCQFKFKVSFLYSFCIFCYPFFVDYSIGFRLDNFFQLSSQLQFTMLSYILSLAISLMGIVIIFKERFKK